MECVRLLCVLVNNTIQRPSQGFLGTRGKKGIYFRGTGEQRQNFEGNRGTKTILGNREHKKTNFRFLGNRGTSQFISGEQGNWYPPPPLGGPQYNIFYSALNIYNNVNSLHKKLTTSCFSKIPGFFQTRRQEKNNNKNAHTLSDEKTKQKTNKPKTNNM